MGLSLGKYLGQHEYLREICEICYMVPLLFLTVFLGSQADLEEERIRQKIAERTSDETIRIYSLRLFLNCIVLAVLSACFYAIYLATTFSQEHMKKVSAPWESADLALWCGSMPGALQTCVEGVTIISLFKWREKFGWYRNCKSADQFPPWSHLKCCLGDTSSHLKSSQYLDLSWAACVFSLTLLVNSQDLSLSKDQCFKIFFILNCTYICRGVGWVSEPLKLELELAMDAGNWTQVHCRSSTHSLTPEPSPQRQAVF